MVYIELGAAGRHGSSDKGRRMGEVTRGGWWREGARGWSEEAMMRGRVGAGVLEGWGVEKGNE